ncbi:methionine ABC transporter permease [Mixta tenebrionis]|uniref:D-methionine transport system permease protein MetI n=1 Tax=Mixta tenebrionis TaxID=2562439 RepID=A0A506VCW5_9GAMM|nr:methionine ABC transporter permease [Mixta tenebrionis]TPW43060.1 ABC transporter permease [Mixta tenebrionis]
MRSMNWERFQALLLNATGETLYMVALAALFTVALGLPVGVLLFLTRREGLLPHRPLALLLNTLVNTGRALPFVVLLIALIPFTRLLIGTTLGSTAAVVPITLGAFPFFARIVENALDEVDGGRVEAVVSMGGNLWHIVSRVLLPEALPSLIAGITLTTVMLIGFSAMAGVVGGGGLGDLAIRYGYQRFDNQIMAATIVVLLALVLLVQKAGDRLVRALAWRR